MAAMATALTPLAKKLKLQPGLRAAVIGGPAGYIERLGPPLDTSVATTFDGLLDWIQIFVRTSPELAAIVEPLTAALSPTGLAWISYPKGSSKLQTDLTRDKGWEPLEGSDLMWLSLVSIDETWSAFGLRPYKPARGATRSRG
jgi:hypothetical protein